MKKHFTTKHCTRLFVMLFALAAVSACASRPAAIGVDASYVVEVTNPLNHAMSVSMNLGANQMSALGSVAAGATQRFEIRDPSTNDIELIATDGSGSHTIRKSVELKRGVVARVTLN